MSRDPAPASASQADALVAEIREEVARERARILDDAAREADAIRGRARDKARRQMRRAVDEMRESAERRLAQVVAEIETARRREASMRAREALDAAWPLLRGAIERRWADDASAAAWIGAQVELAHARLRAPHWVVRHPANADPARMTALRAALAAPGVAEARLQPDANLDAGLVVEAGGARLDGTPAALLAVRSDVEAALLAEIARAPDGNVAHE